MDEVPSAPPGAQPSTLVVETEGDFGKVCWNVGKQLYDVLPRTQRDDILQMTADRELAPFYERMTERLLEQAGCPDVKTGDLDRSWSFETTDWTCECVGAVIWNIGQGLWDNLPADQRGSLLELMQAFIAEFLHQEVVLPLQVFAHNKLRP